jgi:uncharacterized protein (UPF0147 family)
MEECMMAKIDITGMQLFKDLIELLKQVTTDERIPTDVREYYIKAIDSTLEEHGNGGT